MVVRVILLFATTSTEVRVPLWLFVCNRVWKCSVSFSACTKKCNCWADPVGKLSEFPRSPGGSCLTLLTSSWIYREMLPGVWRAEGKGKAQQK